MLHFDIMDPRWRILHTIGELEANIPRHLRDLTPLPFQRYRQTGVNTYELLEDGVLETGQLWNETDTYRITLAEPVLSQWEGEDVYLELDMGGELEVYVDGIPMGSIDPEHPYVCVARKARAGEVLHLEISATRHIHNLVRSRRAFGHRYPAQILERAVLCTHDRVLEAYCMLGRVLLGLIASGDLPEETNRQLEALLKRELYRVDVHGACNARDSLLALRRGLEELHMPELYGTSLAMAHSHLDLAFKWGWADTVRKIERTLSNTCSLLEAGHSFSYIQSQTVILETLQKTYPELFRRVQKQIAAGNIQPVGDLYCEFDANMASGESIIRHILYGKAYCRDTLHTGSRVCYLPDTFGFSGILPQILTQAGYHAFVTSKLTMNDTNPFPYSRFLWQGIDGSRIPSHLLVGTYGGNFDIPRLRQGSGDFREQGYEEHIYQYGAGDGGGGVSEGMLLELETIRQLPGISRVKHTNLEDAMTLLCKGQDTWPTWAGELYLEAHRGVYTSQGLIKQGNRRSERLWREGEITAVMAAEAEGTWAHYPDFQTPGKVILFHQFHDILAGSLVRSAVEEALENYQEVESRLNGYIAGNLSRLLSPTEHLTLWNPLGHPRKGVVRLSREWMGKDFFLLGKKLEVQTLADGVALNVPAIPAMGAVTLSWQAAPTKKPSAPRPCDCLENSRYVIRFNAQGEMTSLVEKSSGREYLRGVGNRIVSCLCRPGYFESWEIEPEYKLGAQVVSEVTRMVLTEDGPLVKTLEITRCFGDSQITQHISIFDCQPQIEIKTRLDMHQRQHLVQAVFQVNVKAPEAYYDLSMGVIARSTGMATSREQAQFEVCAHQWVDYSQESHGIAILSDSKYGFSVKGQEMTLTLAKTSEFPDPEQDLGVQEFTYALLPHAGDRITGRVALLAQELNSPCIPTRGSGIPEEGLLEVSENLIVTCLKKAEEGDGIVLRCYEWQGQSGTGWVRWRTPRKGCTKCTVLEAPLETLPGKDGKDWGFPVRPYEIVTLMFS